ncbi:MAG: LacI family transcriptional regulator [Saprospiraceae bacterium]|jgi:LacI family transcriptional regulator
MRIHFYTCMITYDLKTAANILNLANKPATQGDVAKAAGVSTATVSRVINQPNSVREGIRLQVQMAIAELDYVADAGARALASKRSRCIGAVIPTLANAIFADGIEAFESCLNQAGFSLMLTTSGYDSQHELTQVKTLIERGVDAVMLVGLNHDPLIYKLLQQRNIPYVLTWAYRRDCLHPCVGFNNYEAAKLLPLHLTSLGHQRFAVISGISEANDRALDRLNGMKDALLAQGIRLSKDTIIECTYKIEAGREACRALLNLPSPPTAILCSNDVLAAGALLECQAGGIKVPDQVSIAGFDDLALSANLTPSLTTMHIPFKLMGQLSAQYLIDRLAGISPQAQQQLQVELRLRHSTAAPNNQH